MKLEALQERKETVPFSRPSLDPPGYQNRMRYKVRAAIYPSTSGTFCLSIPTAARRPKARSSATRMKRTPTWSGCPRSRADSRPGDPDDRPNPDPSDDTSDESSHSDAVVCVTVLKSTGHRASLGRKAPVGPASHALPAAIPRSRIETSSSEFAKGSTCFVRPSPRAP